MLKKEIYYKVEILQGDKWVSLEEQYLNPDEAIKKAKEVLNHKDNHTSRVLSCYTESSQYTVMEFLKRETP